MQIIQTEKQKDNLAKFFWDMAKVALTLLVIGPFAKPESISSFGLLGGTVISILLGLWGYILRWYGGPAMNPFTAAFSIFAVLVLIGLFIILFDTGLKWKGKPR